MAIAEFETYHLTPDTDRPYDEAASIQKMRDGDAEAFTDIYDRYSGEMRGYLINTAGGKLPRDALEDILQDSFLKAFEHIGSYSDQGRGLGAWIFTITRNNLMTQFRKQSRREFIEGIEFQPELDSGIEKPHDDYMQSLTSTAIVSYLLAENIVDPDQLHAILAQKVAGQSSSEYAETYNIPRATALTRTHRGIKKVTTRFGRPQDLLDEVFPDN